MVQTNSAEERKLSSGFDSVKRTLLREEFSDRWEKPLAYWALPNDRRLPLAFLGKSVGELLHTPFDELLKTRGVGQKKISSLVKLLHRATSDSPPQTPFGLTDLVMGSREGSVVASVAPSDDFDPANVSEALWSTWCDTVRRFGLQREFLGHLAPSLEPLPTVIWKATLADYADRTLMEIRQLRTHGEKRVRVVLEVFHSIHRTLGNVPEDSPYSVRLVPRFVADLEAWIADGIRNRKMITNEDFLEHVVRPLLRQIETDSGEMVYELTRQRLGIDVPQRSVREQAHDLGVTRARVYQMLEDCGKVMEVRWPEGKTWIGQLDDLVDTEVRPTLRIIRQLYFPGKDVPLDDMPADYPGSLESYEVSGASNVC